MIRIAKRFRTLSLFLFAGLLGCLTPINLPLEFKGGHLVVTGQISTLCDQNIILLGTTANTYKLPNPISGASVVLQDNMSNSYIFAEDQAKPGTYKLPDFSGVPGRTYRLEIVLRNGNTYQSRAEKMPDSATIESTYYEFAYEELVDDVGANVHKLFIKIYVNTAIRSNDNQPHLKWSVEEIFLLTPTDFPDIRGEIPPPCFIRQNADPQRITLFDASEFNVTSLKGVLTASRVIDWTFMERHYFTVYQSSLTPEAYQYWAKVNALVNQQGSIFDTPPATITGNLFNVNDSPEEVFGFFQATNQSYSRFFLHSSDLPIPLLVEKCDFDGSYNQGDYPTRCFNCDKVLNSSFNRPDWF